MFLGLEWYWWIVIILAAAVVMPFKIKFLKWRDRLQQERKEEQQEKWGNEE